MELIFWISILTGPPVLLAEVVLIVSILGLRRAVDKLTADTETIIDSFKASGGKLEEATRALTAIADKSDRIANVFAPFTAVGADGGKPK